MPRFVILEHDHPYRHWDLLLEDGPVLLAWRLPPDCTWEVPVAAERLPDHRLRYLDYEGPISGDRGSVVRRMAGNYDWQLRTDQTLRVSLRPDSGPVLDLQIESASVTSAAATVFRITGDAH